MSQPWRTPPAAPPDTGQNNVAFFGGEINKQIIMTTLVIMGVGILRAWTSNPPQGITTIVLGGYVLMVVLSIVDLFGGPLASLTRIIAMLALVSVLLIEGV